MVINKVSKEGVDMTQAGIHSVHAKEAQQQADLLQKAHTYLATEGKSLSYGDPFMHELWQMVCDKRLEARNYYNKAKKIRDEYSK